MTEFITMSALLMGRDKEFPLTEQYKKNAEELLKRVNGLLAEYSKDTGITEFKVSSGYRPGHYNTDAGGAKASAHLTCSAVDIADGNEALDTWICANRDLLHKYNVDIENGNWTPGWLHLDSHNRSGTDKRWFIPNSSKPPLGNKYDYNGAFG